MEDAYQVEQDEQILDKIFTNGIIDVSLNCIAVTYLFILFSLNQSLSQQKKKEKKENKKRFFFPHEFYLLYRYDFLVGHSLCQTILQYILCGL